MHKQTLILTVGYPASGKSTLVAKIRQEFPLLNIVNGDPLRDLLRKEMPYFNSLEFSEMTPEVIRANTISKEYKKLVIQELVRSGQLVFVEGNHLEKKARDKWLNYAKEIKPDIKTAIIYFKINDEELLERYKQREVSDPNAAWVSEFSKWRKNQMEEPTSDEATELIVFNQTNQEEVLNKLKEFISK